jgi:S1-C subfamily serine protease
MRHYHLPNKKGLFVTSIEPDTPASRSQLTEGDILVSFNGKAVNSSHKLFQELSKKEILTSVNISLIRHSELLHFVIFPTARKKQKALVRPD